MRNFTQTAEEGIAFAFSCARDDMSMADLIQHLTVFVTEALASQPISREDHIFALEYITHHSLKFGKDNNVYKP